MADFGNVFGNMFGGDFANSFAKGMQIGLMQQHQQMLEQKMKQDYEMNHLLKEEATLKIRSQRNLLDESMKQRQQYGELFQKGTQTVQTSPEGYDWSAGEEVPAQTTTVNTPSKAESVFGPQMSEMLRMAGPEGLKGILPELVKEKRTAPPHTTLGGKMYEYVGGKWNPVEGVGGSGKMVERTVDLGNQVEYIYADGTRETKPKGRVPSDKDTVGETGAKESARIQARVATFEKLLGRKLSKEEIRNIMLKDPYNLIEEGGGAMPQMPPANQHSGKVIKDTVTGKRYKSDGKIWQEIK